MGKPTYLAALALVATAAVAGLAGHYDFVEVNLEGFDAAELGTRLLVLIFAALVIERAVEVHVNTRYGPEELETSRSARVAETRLRHLLQARRQEDERPPSALGTEREMEEHTSRLRELGEQICAARSKRVEARFDAEPSLEAIRARKSAAAAIMSTLLGLMVALVGIRVLGQFLPVNEAGEMSGPLAQDQHGRQLSLFRFTDVLLTALLLAGGADGIHQILRNLLGKRKELADL